LQSLLRFWTAALLLAAYPAAAQTAIPAQPLSAPTAQPGAAQSAAAQPAAAAQDKDAPKGKQTRNSDRRRAARLFIEASKLFEKDQFDEALDKYKQAAALDPSNRDYPLAAEVARSHEVTALSQSAAKNRMMGDASAERAALEKALALDPRNIQVTEQLHEMGDDALIDQSRPIYEQAADTIGGALVIAPTARVHSFHLHTDQRRTIQEVFKAYGIEATVDDSVRLTQARLDIDDASFDQAAEAVGLITDSFYVPLDTHRVIVARNTPENHRQFDRLELETIYLPGLTSGEMTEVETLARNVFEFTHATIDANAGTITVRASSITLDAFNTTLHDLIDGHNQVLLEITLIQLAHTNERNTGLQPPQSMSLYNVDAEVQSLISQNQALIQQIISSGLAAPGDTLAILGILLASGQVTSPLFSNGSVEIGGNCSLTAGKTCSPSVFALTPGAFSANISLNSSDSRELEHMMLRLSDGTPGSSDAAAGTIKSGTRYPIQTASFSGIGGNIPNIPGLTGTGTSSALSSLLGSINNSVPNFPEVQYQDLGLTLKASPKVMRNDDVALTVDMKIEALAGSSIDGNPILTSRAYSGVVTLKSGTGVVVISDLDKQESRAISGLPALSEIPGLNNVTDKDVNHNGSTLLIIMTPHVIRGTQAGGHTPMLRIERTAPR
jgi:tetratricopeptide (TPR) repeat protein